MWQRRATGRGVLMAALAWASGLAGAGAADFAGEDARAVGGVPRSMAAQPVNADEPVELKPVFVKGDRWGWTLNAVERVSGPERLEDGARPEPRECELTVELRCKVLGSDGPEGDRVRLLIMLGKTKFRARLLLPGEGTNPTPTMDVETETSPMILNGESVAAAGGSDHDGEDAPEATGAQVREFAFGLPFVLAGTVLRVDVDRTGRVLGVSGLEAVYEKARRAGPEAVRLLGPLAPGVVGRTLEMLLRIDEPRAAEAPSAAGEEDNATRSWVKRRVGDSWAFVETSPLGPQGALNCAATLRWARTIAGEQGEGAVAEIEGQRECEVVPADGEADPAVPRVSLEEQSQRITARWNVPLGRLIAREVEARVTTSAALGEAGRGVEQRTTLRTTLRVTPLVEDHAQGSDPSRP